MTFCTYENAILISASSTVTTKTTKFSPIDAGLRPLNQPRTVGGSPLFLSFFVKINLSHMGPNFDLKRGRKVPTKNSTPTVNRRANFQSRQLNLQQALG